MAIDSKDMALRGKIGGYSRGGKYTREQLREQSWGGLQKSFIPNDPNLSPEEALRMGRARLKAHMHRLARLSALKRRNHKQADCNLNEGCQHLNRIVKRIRPGVIEERCKDCGWVWEHPMAGSKEMADG